MPAEGHRESRSDMGWAESVLKPSGQDESGHGKRSTGKPQKGRAPSMFPRLGIEGIGGQGKKVDVRKMKLHDPEDPETHRRVRPEGLQKIHTEFWQAFKETDKKQNARKKVIGRVDDMGAFLKNPGGDANPEHEPGPGKGRQPPVDIP